MSVKADDIPSQYDAKQTEARLYAFWEKNGVFSAPADSKKEPYCIIMPPPNVTGILHMGHALMCTIEDVMTRWKRMQGYNTLWLPGTDHAGIATQMMVERHIQKEENKTKHDLGREEFLKRVWKWKEASQGTILSQMQLLGCSADWSRLKFTLDDDVSLAVRTCFKRLYDENLIYREQAIIQWCPRCRTALSDLEVKPKEKAGKFWHIRYVLDGDPSKALVVATTRPETLLGDVAVAVHPEDERYQNFHGKKVKLPLTGRSIPVITDDYVDREFGTGALKITPGHDANDYLVGKRHKLPVISIFDDAAVVNDLGGAYKGLTREKAREKILLDLDAQQLLVKEIDHTHSVGHCDRCATIVEPRVSAQWFVNAEVLAQPAIRAVETKEIKIIPEEWEKTYFEWMRNIRPWCISRQLWWGHRIPVWYCEVCQHPQAGIDAPTKCEKCGNAKLLQDEDVLDTWFSSGLWPISTLGWPNDSADLKKFYPTDVMETGFDILFFWVARMIMLGMKMTGKIPFHTIYLHPMVRDEYGQKMSKTKGNVVDPLEIIKEMGADSLRFFFVSNCFHGRDVRVSDAQLESSRHFVNKIWNAARFVLMRFGDVKTSNVDLKNPVNQWIWTALGQTKREVNEALEQYRFFDAANKLYHFLWNTYCFWFIEFIKSEEELTARQKAKESTAVEVLDEVLRLLHPLMPFLTEELWQKLPLRKSAAVSIATAEYPKADKTREFPETYARVERACRVVESVRNMRGVANLLPTKEIAVILVPFGGQLKTSDLSPFSEMIAKLVRASSVTVTDKEPDKETHSVAVISDVKIYVPQSDLGDVAEIRSRKLKELQDKKEALARAQSKLQNEKFMSGAPEAVRQGVVKQRDDLAREVTALKEFLGEA